MPTNVLRTNAPITTGGNVWSGIGGGLQGLGAIVGAAMQARAANNSAKDSALMAKSSFDSSLGAAMPSGFRPSVPMSKGMSPQSGIGPMAVTSLTRSPIGFALPSGNLGTGRDAGMTGGGGAGFQSLFAQRFPSLFPQTASQYGGL